MVHDAVIPGWTPGIPFDTSVWMGCVALNSEMSYKCRVHDVVSCGGKAKNDGIVKQENTMDQPDLGIRVTELRQQKGLTQEQLAEYCHVSTRTIQRIESGDVNPRSHTLHCLHGALDFDFGEPNTPNEEVLLAAMHLSSMICIPVIPLLIWSLKKNQSSRIDWQGRQVINFQVTMALTLFAAAFVLFLGPVVLILLEKGGVVGGSMFAWLLIIAPLPMIAIGIYCTYQAIANTIRAMSDRHIRYVPSIPFMH